MARIPNNELDRLKREVALVRLVESSGIELKKHGKDYLGLCPFHKDKEPSLVISPDKNLWHCLGACAEGGDVIQWVMKRQGVSFRHAVELLKDGDAALSVPAASVKRNTTAKHSTSLAANPDDQKQLAVVIDYYHETLKQSPEALDYLKSRGLHHPELIDTFRLGYANRTLGYRLPEKNRKAGAEVRGQLQNIGILRKSGHEHFSGSLVIPVISPEGIITEVYGRKLLGAKLRKGTPQHLYLPGAHTGVFNEQALQATDEIILCESLIDALTFWVVGYRNVTASYGTSGFTEDHLAAFKHHNIKRILIAYDRDEAGNTAAEQLVKKLTAEGIDCFRVLFPKNMDANEYAMQVTPAAKSLGVVLRSAEWMDDVQGSTSVAGGRKPGATKGEAPTLNTGCASDEIIDTETGEMLTIPESTVEPKSSNLLAAKEESTPEPTTASPQPKPADQIEADISEHEINMTFGDRQYRIRGLQKNLSFEVLKVNVLVRRNEAFHVDALELYNAKQRAAYIKAASIELGMKDDILKRDLGKVLLKCEALQEQQIKKTLAPEKPEISLTESEQTAALELLKSPDLMNRILEDFERCGVVGEATNTLIGYLACVSRKLDKPLAVMIQSTSAAGKSTLMDAILALMPEEERVQYSAMTGQSLFYMGETNLKHKILAIAEEEGAEQASYALKLLQSEGVITIASTGKDDTTGDMVTKEYRVEGPVMLFLTTTAIDIDEELMNRCLVLSVNETRDQTQAIHAMQRKQQTLEGLLAAEDKKHILHIHQNAQRLIKPLLVANPYAEKLSFIDDKTRTRRDHLKYLTLIRSIALLHQYQRETKTVTHNGQRIEYIEVTLNDIETANCLANEVLGRTLDELPPQTRKLLKHIHAMVKKHCKAQGIEQKDHRFSRRDIRETVGWGNTQTKLHLKRLEDMEYLLVHRGGRGQSIVYELLYQGEGEDGESFLVGLIDVESLGYDEKKSGVDNERSGSSRPQVAPESGSSRDTKNAVKPDTAGHSEKADKKSQKRTSKAKNNGASYDGQEAQVSRAHGRAGAPRNHSDLQESPALAADGV